MTRAVNWLGYGLALLLAGQVSAATADAVAELLAARRLQLETVLSPQRNIVPEQKVTLTLVIATDRWFSGGTRISIPEVPGLVILQTQQFASNASETRAGQSWVVQRWELDVYPQRAGEFTIPAMPVRVQVNVAEAGDIAGDLRTGPVSFSASLPQGLAQAQHWVAAPAFEVRQSFDRSLAELQVGDAFEREIVFEASEVMAMMLPSVVAEEIPGLAAYPSPPALENNSNRGQITASRSERISYVVEAQGSYQLPAREYFWWDTGAGELRLLSLPATQITVGSGAAQSAKTAFEALPFSPRQLLATVAGLIVLSALLWLTWQRLPPLPAARLRAAWSRLDQLIKALRKPALPEQLNPDSSSAD